MRCIYFCTVLATCCIAHLLLSACGPTEWLYPEIKEPEAKDFVRMHLDSGFRARFQVVLHSKAKAGQYWETASGVSPAHKEGWLVAAERGEHFILEYHRHVGGSEWLLAYLVGPPGVDASEGRARVYRAWIGEHGGNLNEIEVTPHSSSGSSSESTVIAEEKFSLVVAGRKWSGTKTTFERENSAPSNVYVADTGWFGGLIRVESSSPETEGYLIELSAFSENEQPWVDWEGVDVRPGFYLNEKGVVVPREPADLPAEEPKD